MGAKFARPFVYYNTYWVCAQSCTALYIEDAEPVIILIGDV